MREVPVIIEFAALCKVRQPRCGKVFVQHCSTCLFVATGGDGAVIYKHACALGCGGIVSKRLGSPYRAGRSAHWLKVKNPAAPAVKREAEEDWR
jgi:hypothetical protein